MFVRADTLLQTKVPMPRGNHVIDFEWEEYRPMLFWYVQRDDKADTVPLSEIDWEVSSTKRCVGRFDHDGYHRCPEAMPVSKFDQCPRCASAWIEHQQCIFEPMCNGERCASGICRKEHTVYMAFFGENAKIGMTTSTRLEGRGIEQGADAIVPLVRAANRLEGRKAEKGISQLLRVTQFVPRKKAVALLSGSVSWNRIEQIYKEHIDYLSGKYDVLREPLERLDGYPLKDIGKGKVDLKETVGRHKGKVVGLKGKFLVYRDDAGNVSAIDMPDLPGRFLSAK
ncbi:MAG: DUF2797 domain-containing protein [Euryarchaeota archaeon]|nr:DUF2797 domain-containing protein [Euryarchaeota archaeon]